MCNKMMRHTSIVYRGVDGCYYADYGCSQKIGGPDMKVDDEFVENGYALDCEEDDDLEDGDEDLD